MLQRGVHGGKILLHDRFAALDIGLFDRALDRGDGFVAGQDAADGKETRLHDGVDAPAHAGLLGDFVSVNHVELEFLFDDLLLHRARQVIPHFFRAIDAVQQERCARLGGLEHVIALEERELVARDKVRRADQVRCVNGARPKAQVRDRHRAGFPRVVVEKALRVIFGVFADDADRVVVGAHRAIRAQAVKQRAHRVFALGREIWIIGQARVRHVVVNANGKVILGLRLEHFVKDALGHRRGEFFGRQAIAPADDARRGLERRDAAGERFADRCDHVHVERLAD